MKSQLKLAIVLAAFAAQPSFAEVTPNMVTFADGAVAQSHTGVAGNAADGAKVASTRSMGNCVACHAIAALPDAKFQGNVGPALDGVGSRWSEAELRGIVSNAKMMFDGTVMPSFYKTEGYTRLGDAYTGKAPKGDVPPILSAQQIEDVVAYLLTLKE